MQRPVLANEGTAVDTHNLIAGEGLLKHLGSTTVVVRLGVGGIEHGSVQDEEVGVGGRQTFAVFHHGVGHGQGEQTIRSARKGTEGLQLLFHLTEGIVMFVLPVVTLHIDNGVVGAEAGQGINVTVRIGSTEAWL